MEDYKETIKELLLRDFTPETNGEKPVFFSTTAILKMVQGVIPRSPVSEHDVFDVLSDLGFKKHLHTEYKLNEKLKPTKDIDYQVYLWVFFNR